MSTSRRSVGIVTTGAGFLLVLFFGLVDVTGISNDPANAIGPRQRLGIGVGLVLLLVGIAIYTHWRPSPKAIWRAISAQLTWTNLGLVVASLLVTSVMVEAAAQIYLWNFATDEQFSRYASIRQLQRRFGDDFITAGVSKLSPHRYLGYYPTANYDDGEDRQNALGYRGEEITLPKPEGTYRIVCLGGSTTYSFGVASYTDSYPYQLQEYLRQQGYSNVEVINAGVIGYSSWESLVNLEFRVLDLDPDMIIVYHGVNDVHPRLVWPPEAYRGDNSGALSPNVSSIRMPPLWEYSTALRTLAIKRGWAESHATLDVNLRPRPNTYYAGLFRRQELDGTYPSDIFLEVSPEEMLDANPPIYFERNLTSMYAIAAENDIEMVLATFAYSTQTVGYARVSSDAYRAAYAEGNDVVRRVAASTGAHLYDFVLEMPEDQQYFAADGIHFTVAGNQLRGKLFGDYLIEEGLLP